MDRYSAHIERSLSQLSTNLALGPEVMLACTISVYVFLCVLQSFMQQKCNAPDAGVLAFLSCDDHVGVTPSFCTAC